MGSEEDGCRAETAISAIQIQKRHQSIFKGRYRTKLLYRKLLYSKVNCFYLYFFKYDENSSVFVQHLDVNNLPDYITLINKPNIVSLFCCDILA